MLNVDIITVTTCMPGIQRKTKQCFYNFISPGYDGKHPSRFDHVISLKYDEEQRGVPIILYRWGNDGKHATFYMIL